MNEIEPWLESGAPSDVVEALRAARREAPSRDLIERCAALGSAATLSLTAAAAATATRELGVTAAGHATIAPAGAAALTLVKWGLGGVLAGSLFAGGMQVARHAAEAAHASVSSNTAVPSAPPASSPLKHAAPEAPSPATGVEPVVESAPPANAAAPSTAHTKPARSDGRLAEELELLHRVRLKLDAGELPLAATLLDEHDRRFGSSAPLSPEARYLRLEVLTATGTREQARALASDIVTRDARGPHAGRAREVLDEK